MKSKTLTGLMGVSLCVLAGMSAAQDINPYHTNKQIAEQAYPKKQPYSPWVDISDAGDTLKTLEYTDPTLHYDPLLKTSAQAYADGLALTDPRVSPLYANFSKGFSPTLITEGTKCIFLSTSVRLFQVLESAGQDAKLDVYEGMWHVFQTSPVPETEVSLKKISAFLY